MALETLEFDGKPYVPSKQAAEATGYTQDYIGQLARGGNILARRVGGLWYINMDSLGEHKTSSEAYVPLPPAQAADRSGSIVSFDGKEYITSKRAAEMTSYTQDYIGQLARGGKIGSRQVAGRWYVSKDDLRAHKEQKDALLAAVQASAVGIRKDDPRDMRLQQRVSEKPLFTYIPGAEMSTPDLPDMVQKQPNKSYSYESRSDTSDNLEIQESSSEGDDENATHHIAIRAMKRDVEIAQTEAATRMTSAPSARSAGYSQHRSTWNTTERPVRRRNKAPVLIISLVVGLSIIAGGSIYASGMLSNAMPGASSSATSTDSPVTTVEADQSSITEENLYEKISDKLLTVFGGTLTYKRK